MMLFYTTVCMCSESLRLTWLMYNGFRVCLLVSFAPRLRLLWSPRVSCGFLGDGGGSLRWMHVVSREAGFSEVSLGGPLGALGVPSGVPGRALGDAHDTSFWTPGLGGKHMLLACWHVLPTGVWGGSLGDLWVALGVPPGASRGCPGLLVAPCGSWPFPRVPAFVGRCRR